VDDKGRADGVEYGVGARAESHPRRHDSHRHPTVWPNGQVGQVACVRALRIAEPMLLTLGIEVPARRRELGRIALAHLVNVESMGARRQLLRLEGNGDPLSLRAQRRS
jgi:hypothetical protein